MGEGVKDARDRALLLIGFAGGFRRSEIVALDCDDVERVRQGLIVTLRRSKTDQEGAGRKVGIPFGEPAIAPSSPSTAGLRSPGSKPAPSSGPSTGMAASPPSGCRAKQYRSSSRSASPPPASTRPATPATACAPASPRAQCRRACRHSRSGLRPATRATPCSPGTFVTATVRRQRGRGAPVNSTKTRRPLARSVGAP